MIMKCQIAVTERHFLVSSLAATFTEKRVISRDEYTRRKKNEQRQIALVLIIEQPRKNRFDVDAQLTSRGGVFRERHQV